MRIEKVHVEGFRLLKDAEILLEPTATVIVGRNNSGKTSLTEVFDRFAGDGGVKFRLEDFAAALRPKFLEAKKKHDAEEDPSAVLATLPIIAVTLSVRYDVAEEFGPFAPFVIDLDPAVTLAIVRVEYKASLSSLDGLFDVPAAEPGVDVNAHFFRQLRRTLPRAYNAHLYAIDPTDETNRRDFDSLAPLLAPLKCGFIGAQRTLDLARSGDTDVIGKLLGELYKTATSTTAAEADQLLANQLKLSVDGIERGIQVDFDSMVKDLLPALAVFGFLELKSLVIGDLDAVYLDDTVKPKKWKKCPVADGVRTSSQALKAWFGIGAGGHLTLADLATKTDEDKIEGFRRIAYQIREEGSTECARSYEDALVLANAAHFGVAGADQAKQAWASRFAFDQATACATGIAQKTVPLSGLRKLVIHLPPLAEQHRIVKKVDALMALCDQLEARLTGTEKTRRRLLEALLAEALAPISKQDLEAAQ